MKIYSLVKKFIIKNYLLISIVLFGFLLRFYGINWDEGHHLHPDERMIIMVADRIDFWKNLNPDFFNYGSFPIYLLRGTSELIDWLFKTNFANYDGMLYIGRFLSVIFDTCTIFLVYRLSKILFNKKIISLISAFCYAIFFFPIQNSHFYVTDPILTSLSLLCVYQTIVYINQQGNNPNQNIKKIFQIGIIFGLILTTKISGLIFLPIVLGAICLKYLNSAETLKVKLSSIAFHLTVFSITILSITIITMPYAYIEFDRFYSDISLQMKMNSDAYIFPYTLQYVGTTPYLYYLKNIFWYGIGPILSCFTVIGFLFLCKTIYQKLRTNKLGTKTLVYILFASFYLIYFLLIGKSAVKFMRYLLPIYPFLAILAGYGIIKLTTYKMNIRLSKFFILLLAGISTLWTLSFVSIYSQKHTRVEATDWINNNISPGSTIAVEHWDDRLPLSNPNDLVHIELPLYDLPDDAIKWQNINDSLENSEYMLLASNRLYIPLQKLNDCNTYLKCYPLTSKYYNDLLNGRSEFKLIKEFEVTPKLKLPFTNFEFSIDDQNADESFTVYDHPKILLFGNENYIH